MAVQRHARANRSDREKCDSTRDESSEQLGEEHWDKQDKTANAPSHCCRTGDHRNGSCADLPTIILDYLAAAVAHDFLPFQNVLLFSARIIARAPHNTTAGESSNHVQTHTYDLRVTAHGR